MPERLLESLRGTARGRFPQVCGNDQGRSPTVLTDNLQICMDQTSALSHAMEAKPSARESLLHVKTDSVVGDLTS